MSSRLARKQCPQCGEESLEQEWACWACGAPFAAPSDAPTMLRMPSRGHGQAVAAAAGLTVLLVGIGLGFWMGRATEARPTEPEPSANAPSAPPSDGALVPAPSLSGGRPGPPVRLPPPAVASRPMGDPWGSATPATPYRRGVPLPSSGTAAPGNAFSSPPFTLPGKSRPRVARAPRSPSGPPYVAPSHGMRVRAKSGDARVTLINMDSVPLSVELRGPNALPMDVAAGMGVPCSAKAGSYRLFLLGRGGARPLGSVLLEPGKSTTIRFDRTGILG